MEMTGCSVQCGPALDINYMGGLDLPAQWGLWASHASGNNTVTNTQKGIIDAPRAFFSSTEEPLQSYGNFLHSTVMTTKARNVRKKKKKKQAGENKLSPAP